MTLIPPYTRLSRVSQAAAERTFAIGKTRRFGGRHGTTDDHHSVCRFEGRVRVFAIADSPTTATATSTNAGKITMSLDAGTRLMMPLMDNVFQPCGPEGMYYEAAGGNNAAELETGDPANDGSLTWG